jgi:hypothetical protein
VRLKARLLLVVLVCAALGAFAWLRLSAPGDAPSARAGTRERSQSPTTSRTPDAQEASISGRVSDHDDQPIAMAEVCANVLTYAARHFRGASCTTSDAQGAYQLSALAPQSYSVSASATGFVAASARDETPLSLRAGELRAGVDLRLSPGDPNLHGSVVDATGGPVPDAHVRVERALAPYLVLDTRTDDLGNFSFTLPEGPVTLEAAAPGYSTASDKRVAPSHDARLVLVPGASLRGRVIARESGLPLAGVELRPEPVGAQPAPLNERPHSDAQGRFAVDGLEPGSYFVSALGLGLRGKSGPYELAVGEVIDNLEIAVRNVAQVSGRVLQSDGRACQRGSLVLGAPDPLHPLPDSTDHIAALMEAPPLSAEIGAEGAVRFAAVVPGKYYVTVRCQGQMLRDGPRMLDVAADDLAGLVWTVNEGASLRVLTVDERDQPVGNVEFRVQLPSLRAWADHSLAARSDAEGRYDIVGILAPGPYRLIAASYYGAAPVKVQVRAGEANVAKLKLTGSAAIEAKLQAQGEPVTGLSVSAVPLDTAAASSGLSEVNPAVASELGGGRYRMAPLPEGRYEVRVEDGINPSVSSQPIELGRGQKAELEVALDRAGKISGHVVDDQGAPVADAWVSAIAEALTAARGASTERAAFATLPAARVLSDGEGEFSFERLAGGSASYTIEVSVPKLGAAQARAVHASNKRIALVLRAVGSISGQIEGVCAQGAFPVTIQVQSLDTGQMLEPVAATPEGSFIVHGVAPGALRITSYCEHPFGLILGVTTAQLAPGQKLEGIALSLPLRGRGNDGDARETKR